MSDKDPIDNVIHVNFGARAPSDNEAPVVSRDELVEPTSMMPYEASLLPDDPLASKKFEVFSLFVNAGMVSVTFDTQTPGVEIPPHFRDRARLVLNFSNKFGIDDFSFDTQAVWASLSFSGQPYFCVIPWAAIKMLLSHHDSAVAVFDEV